MVLIPCFTFLDQEEARDTPPRITSPHYRLAVLFLVVLLCIFLAVYVNILRGIEIVYTHVFYLPIILAGVWFYKKAVLVAFLLGFFHLGASYVSAGFLPLTSVIRASMFLLVALVVGILAEKGIKLEAVTRHAKEIEGINQELTRANQRISEGIEKARVIHGRLLPQANNSLGGLSLAAVYKPAEHMGGDFYNFIQQGDQLIIYLVDVSGHGLDGSMLNIFIRENINRGLSLREQVGDVKPAEIIDFLSQQYLDVGFPDDYFICILVSIFNKKTGNLCYSNAGMHIAPQMVTPEGRLERLDKTDLPIMGSLGHGFSSYRDNCFKFPRGATLFLTTDGLVEQQQGGKMYGEERLERLLLQSFQGSAPEIARRVLEDFNDFTGPQAAGDDITFLVIKNDLG